MTKNYCRYKNGITNINSYKRYLTEILKIKKLLKKHLSKVYGNLQ